MNEFDKLSQAVKKQMQRAIEESVIIIESDAKLLCPVNTGTLKRSITYEVNASENKVKGSVGSNVEYAYWVDKKRPYLEASVDKNLDNVKRKIEEVLKNAGIDSTKVTIRP